MYLQSIFGPRFFFPFKKSIIGHKYYHSKEEILEINKDYEFVYKQKLKINFFRLNV